MANRIVSVHAGIYGMGIYAIMLPSSGFSVAHWSKYHCYKQATSRYDVRCLKATLNRNKQIK